MRRSPLLFVLPLLALLAATGQAQNLNGTIVGSVTDPTGRLIPNVDVVATNLGTGQVRTTTTGDTGTYVLAALATGDYEVSASAAGFDTAVIPTVEVQNDQAARHDIELVVGQVATEITVSAGAPLLQTEKSSVGSVVDQVRINSLPLNGRDYGALAQLLPGVVTPAQGSEIGQRGGFNVAGRDENTNSIYVDGFDNIDPVLRNGLYKPILDGIEEFSVEQNSYNAEFGRNAGAVINVTTKSGTNQFHGTLWEYHRNDNLDARNVFARDTKPDLLRNQFGATFGGPIIENKTFLFLAWESLREKSGVVKRAFVPSVRERQGDFSESPNPIFDWFNGVPFEGNMIPPERLDPIGISVIRAYPLPNVPDASVGQPNRIEVANHITNVDDISARIDSGLNDGTTLNARYSYSDSRIVDPFRDDTPGSSVLKDFGQSNSIARTNAGIGFTSTIGTNIVHEFRAGFNRFVQIQNPLRAAPPEQAGLVTLNDTFQVFRVDGLSNIGGNRSFDRAVNVYNYVDQTSVVTGDHLLKFGADIRRYLFNAGSYDPNTFQFFPAFTGNATADLALGLAVRSFKREGDAYLNPRKTEVGLFAQDSWKITPTLTLNYGLRWEWYGRITENIDEQSNWLPDCNCIVRAGIEAPRQLVDDDWNNFAPRLGLAWRPFGNQSTVLRAGGGIFYDNEQRHNFFLATNIPFLTSTIHSPATLTNPFPQEAGFPFEIPFAIPVDFRDTYAGHWNLGIQKQVLPETVVDVAYVGSRFVKMQRRRNVNDILSDGSVPFERFSAVLLDEQAANASYHSLQVRVDGRPTGDLALISAYTWGHSMDDRPAQATASIYGPLGTGIQHTYDLSKEWANSDFDTRHRYSMSAVYDVPDTGGPGVVGHVLDGWGLNAILLLQSGRPLTVEFEDRFGGPTSLRPDVVAGVDPVPGNQSPDNWINPAAFAPPANRLGTLGRNTITSPGLAVLDFSVVKDFATSESTRLQFRTEFFNALNHPNFGLPNRTFGDPGFGVIGETTTNARQIQFALRYEY